MPTEVILPEAERLAEVLARRRKEFAVDVEDDPVDDPAVAHRTALRLPPLPGPQPEDRQVVGNLRRAGHPAAHAAADGVGSRVVFIAWAEDIRRSQRRGLARNGAVVPVGNVAAVLVDRVVVDLIVEWKLRDALRAIGIGELRLPDHLVGEAVHVPELALHRVVGRPHRQRGADADLPVSPIDRRLRDVLAPVCQFAEGIGNDLHHARLEGQVDLLPRRQPLANHVVFVGERRPDARPLPRRGRLRQVLPHVRHARVLIPRQRVLRERLPQPVVVEPRPPLALGEERVHSDARQQPQFAVLDRPAQVEPGALFIPFLPLRLVVFLEEVHVADPAGRAASLPAAEEALGAAADILPVPPERTAAERLVWIAGIGEGATVQTEVVLAHVADEPGVEVAAGRAAKAEEVGAVVEQRCAAAGAALAQVVDVEVPVDAVRRPPHAKHLKGVPTGEQLRAEDAVVLDLRVVDVEGRLLRIGRQHRPPEHRHAADRERVAAAGDELLVLDDRLTSDGIDRPLAAGPGQWHLLVGELEFAGAELPARHPQAA